MKFLRFIPSMNPADGGPVESVLRSSMALADLGHGNTILCLDPPGSPWLQTSPVEVHALGPGVFGRYRFAPRAVDWLSRNASAFDAVIVHGIWSYNLIAAWRALRESAVPYFVFAHGMLDPWFLEQRGLSLKPMIKRTYWALLARRSLRAARSVLFTCAEEQRLALLAYGDGYYGNRVISYGTADAPGLRSENVSAFVTAYPALQKNPFLLFLGRIHPKKGCDILLEAYAAVSRSICLPDLVFAGPDETGWRAQLEQRGEELGIASRVHWTGLLTGQLKWGALQSCEAFVLPSHQENFGIAAAEAMACSKPVLLTEKVNIWREVEQARAGLISSDDRAGVERQLRYWFSMPPDQRLSMGTAARQCFVTHFHVDRLAEELAQLVSDQGGPPQGTAELNPFHRQSSVSA
jgi:glycosyltransferase involved in cell wall biosynthesis